MRIDAHSSAVSADSAFVRIRKRAIQLTEDMVFGASVKPHPFQGDKKDNGDGIGRCKECGKPWKYKAHWRLAADGVNAYEMRDNNGVFLDEDDIDDVDAGGPGSGWTAENGHVSHLTPQAKGQKLQKVLMRVMEADGWKFEVEGKTITVTMPPTWSAAAWWKSIHQPVVVSVSSSEDEEAATFSPGVAMRNSIREKALGVESKAYKLAGLTSFQGLPISIETKKGQVRKGQNHDGTPWQVVMPADYGYIKGTKGADGQHVDCFIGPLKDAKFAYIFHINNDATGDYDEDKALLGFKSADACTAMLKQAYDNWDEISHSMTMLPMHEFIRKVLHTAGLKRPGKINAAEVL